MFCVVHSSIQKFTIILMTKAIIFMMIIELLLNYHTEDGIIIIIIIEIDDLRKACTDICKKTYFLWSCSKSKYLK